MINKMKSQKIFHSYIRPQMALSYTWQELNCFYRPFAYAFQGADYGKEGIHAFLFLISLYMTHSKTDNSKMFYNRLHPALWYYESELQHLFDTLVEPVYYSSERDMHRKAAECLSKQCEIVVPYDLFVLPYSQNYLEQHHRHYLLVKGCDSKKEIYYLLDNMHNDLGESTDYTDFMMPYHQIYLGAEEFHRHYNTMCAGKSYFWKIQCQGKMQEVWVKIWNYFRKVWTGFLDGSIPVYYVEQDMKKEYRENQMFDMVEQINMRNVYYGETLVCLKYQTGMEKEQFERLTADAEKLKKNWNVIKILLMRRLITQELDTKLQDTILMEKKWHEEILRCLQDKAENIAVNKDNRFRIHNPLCAGVERMKSELTDTDRFHVTLSEQMVYDTWKLKDDACQILYPVENESMEMEVKVHKLVAEEGRAFHLGIILKSAEGKKILYGNSRNLHLVVFMPEKDIYECYQSDYVFEEVDNFKVVLNGRECSFYIKESKDWRMIDCEKAGFKPVYIGFFIKSWERCRCELEAEIHTFSNGGKS